MATRKPTKKTSQKKTRRTTKEQTKLVTTTKSRTPKNANKRYPQKKVAGTDKDIDRMIPAKRVGWRYVSAYFDEKGKYHPAHWYFEDRENRSDTDKEIRYHKGNRTRPKPNSRTEKPSQRSGRATKSTQRVTNHRKRDPQKPAGFRVSFYTPKTPKTTPKKGIIWALDGKPEIYKPTKTKILPAAELEKLIMKEMKKIHKLPIEHKFIMDRCGNVLLRTHGTTHSVRTPWQVMSENIDRYLIHVHNHPASEGWCGQPNPFSPRDLGNQAAHSGSRNPDAHKSWADTRVCSQGKFYKCVVINPTLAPKKQTILKNANAIYNSAGRSVRAENPFEPQKDGETEAAYRKRREAHQKKVARLISERVNDEFTKYFIAKRGYEYTTGDIK